MGRRLPVRRSTSSTWATGCTTSHTRWKNRAATSSLWSGGMITCLAVPSTSQCPEPWTFGVSALCLMTLCLMTFSLMTFCLMTFCFLWFLPQLPLGFSFFCVTVNLPWISAAFRCRHVYLFCSLSFSFFFYFCFCFLNPIPDFFWWKSVFLLSASCPCCWSLSITTAFNISSCVHELFTRVAKLAVVSAICEMLLAHHPRC